MWLKLKRSKTTVAPSLTLHYENPKGLILTTDVNDQHHVASPRGNVRAVVKVDLDIWQSLIRFAAVGLVDRTGWTRAQIAKRLGKTPPNFHMALFGRTGRLDEPLTRSFCNDLQRVLHSIPDLAWLDAEDENRRSVPMLTTLYEELDESTDADSGLRIHAAWFPDLCQAGPARTTVEVLVRGEALRDMLKDAQSRRERDLLLAGQN